MLFGSIMNFVELEMSHAPVINASHKGYQLYIYLIHENMLYI